MDSWLLSRDVKKKKKSKGQPRNNHKNRKEVENNRQDKAMRIITPSMDHCPRNGQMGGTDL